MSIKNRLITVFLSVMLCLTAFGINAGATEGQDAGEAGYDDSIVEPSYDEPPAEPSQDEPPAEPSYDEPSYEPSYNEPSYEPSYNEPQYSQNNDYYGNNNSQYSEYNDVNSYLGGDQSYVEPNTVASSAALYNVDKNKIDDNELKSSEWKSILSNINSSSSGSDSDDFGFIKNNTAKGDNGHGILFTGIGCIALGIAGIVYVIVSKVVKRRRVAIGTGGSDAPKRASNDYADGYRAKSDEAKSKRRSKFDTADVKLPSSSGGTRYKNSNGKRYK